MQIDMEKVTAETIQQLGAENAMLRFELNAQRAAVAKLQEQAAAAEPASEAV